MADASAIVELLLLTPACAALEARIIDDEIALHAPYLIDIEVAHVIRRYAAHGQVTAARGRSLLRDLFDLPLQRYTHNLLLPRVWELRHNLSAYDATYVALAELLDAPLLTRDRRLAAAAGHHARIEFL